jgi:cytochrome c oxidase cbb3-type subunit I/II
MLDPRATSPGSIMPPYPWLRDEEIDLDVLPRKIAAMRKLGVPYTDAEEHDAVALARAQGDATRERLAKDGVTVSPTSALVALTSYLQRLGVDGRQAASELGPVAQEGGP